MYALLPILLLALAPAADDEVPLRRPTAADPAATGELYEWPSDAGPSYRYRVPADYDAERGVAVTLILHGSNLDRRWGFWNHRHETFRTRDVVVSVDGTTPNGQGGFNLLGREQDAAIVHAFLEEIRGIWNVRAVYAYGHSQGSFYAIYHAGLYPDDLQGIVAHASGIWTWTRLGKHGHAIPIVLMHGTQDPAVPYWQSAGGLEALRDAKYPMARLRSLEGWNHWPAEHNMNHLGQNVRHTSQQLAWVEGMSTDDPAALEACFALLCDNTLKERHDYGGLWSLATRIADREEVPAGLARDARRAAAAVDELAAEHVDALDLPKKLTKPSDEAWVGHLPMFLRTFEGVPACEDLRKKRRRELAAHAKAADAAFRDYGRALEQKDRAEAFRAGLEALESAFLDARTADRQFRSNLREWRAEGEALGLKKKELAAFDELFEPFEQALERGSNAFDRVNRKAPDLG